MAWWRTMTAGIRGLMRKLGLGATTALVSVAYAVLLRPLPVTDPQALVLFRWSAPRRALPPISIAGMGINPVTGEGSSLAFSYAAFRGFQTSTRTLSDVFAFTSANAAPSAPGLNDGAAGQLVSGNYFIALETKPQFGRLLIQSDDQANAPLVTVISDRYWKGTYGADPSVVGKLLRLRRATQIPQISGPPRFEDATAEIVGVTPPEFTGVGQLGDVPDFFLPLLSGATASDNKFAGRMSNAWVWPFRIMGRLRPGATIEDVQQELQAPFNRAIVEAWTTNPRRSSQPLSGVAQLRIVPGALGLTNTRENLSRSVRILGATVAVLLLIVCINLINLLLARAESRRAEMAVRLAIGAGRWRLVRQLVTEVCLLTLCGGVAGLVVARWAKDLALVWVGRMIPGFELTIPLDERVVGIAAALALVVSVVIGIIPALRATRVDANPALKNASPGTTGRRQIVGPALLVAQVALAVVMVVTAGLLVKTLRNLETADLGFNSENVLLFKANRAEASSAAPRTIDNPASALDRMVDRINGLPGVHAVAFSQYSLLQGEVAMPFLHIPGLAKAPDEDRTVYTQAVSPTFFSTMEMPLTAGRSFAAGDRNVPVAIVNETLARRFFSETGALGRHIGITKDPEAGAVKDAELLEIVGIVRDAKYMTIREQTLPTVFLARIDDGPVVFAVRTSVAPMSLVAAVTQATREARPAMVSSEFRTEAEQAARTFAEERHFAWVASVFGVLALLLTSIGLYGLLSYSVARRTREIGIRVALGANRGRVMRSVLGETLGVITLGAVIGLIAASMTTRVVQSLLFGLAPSDLIAQAAAVSAIFIVAFLAAVVPARRAARVDPVIALRTD